MPGQVREGSTLESSEHWRFPACRREMDGLRVGYGRQTLLAVATQPTFGQEGRWNVSQMGNVGSNVCVVGL